jgi:hypothetical protein
MSEGGMTDREVGIALELAGGHLEDAENVIWEASARAESPEVAADLEELTRRIWRVEHAVDDLRAEIERTAEGEAQASDA